MAPLLVIVSFRGVTGGIEWAESYSKRLRKRRNGGGKEKEESKV
jgi:hypothetical protein